VADIVPTRTITKAATPSESRLHLSSVSKTYGSTRVLSDVDLSLAPGEIHGLVGQNGSGKSTLIKILSGLVRPDPGARLVVDGENLSIPARPAHLNAHGVSFVHQDLGLINDASIVENVRMGILSRNPFTRRIRWSAEVDAARATLERLHCMVDPRAQVSDLPPGQRALVAIARALQTHEYGRGCIVFDESTQSLPRESLPEFYDVVRGLAREGTSVLLVSHRLDEVLQLADRVTVLQDGVVVAGGCSTEGITELDLARLILGKEIELATPAPIERPGAPDRKPLLQVRGLATKTLRGVAISVAPGEIVGVTGGTDSGFAELPVALGGGSADSPTGIVHVGPDTELDLARSTARDHIAAGIALVPEQRAADGLAIEMTALENLTLLRIDRPGNRLRLRSAWQRNEFDEIVRTLGVVPSRPNLLVRQFSGGNQQKILLGKWLLNRPQVLILHEPTQAVDIGARVDILTAVREAAADGTAVIMCSVEAQDLVRVCDRILVIKDGVIHCEFGRGASVDEILEAL
jgi:ribose transport system ATP-binding protein